MCSQHGHSEVQEVIFDGLATVRTAGILATDPAMAQQYLARARCSWQWRRHDAAVEGGERAGAAVRGCYGGFFAILFRGLLSRAANFRRNGDPIGAVIFWLFNKFFADYGTWYQLGLGVLTCAARVCRARAPS